jgi:hypothetical protein
MNTKEYKTFKYLHNYVDSHLDKRNDDGFNDFNKVSRTLLIRNIVMNMCSPDLFYYILKNKI